MFSAGCEFSDLIRAMGHTGMLFNLYIWDGAMFESESRCFRGRHALFYD